MSILFSVYMNNYQNLTKLSREVIVESKKIVAQATSASKSIFISLLNSISNSFASLQKKFFFSAANEKKSSNKEDSIYLKTVPLIIVDNAKENAADYLSSKPPRHNDFNNLKSEMHIRLNACFNHKINA